MIKVSSNLTREQILDLLDYIGSPKIKDHGKDDIQFCCTVHGENTPSAGVSIDKQCFNCLSCHESGSISWLIFKSLPDEFKNLNQVDVFLQDRYGIDLHKFDSDQLRSLRRYEDHLEVEEPPKRFESPMTLIAPFKSGKETYQYFYDRGFSKQTVTDFKIGRDIESGTVTIPVFWEDHKLAGAIGRYIDPLRAKNERYKIYSFPKGSLTFPLDKLEVGEDETIILVEGILDALWMHQLGFKNTQAILGNGISIEQADIIKGRCKKVIFMFDNDSGGELAIEISHKRLGSIPYYKVEYPKGKKDPQEMTKEQIQYMIDNKIGNIKSRLRRI